MRPHTDSTDSRTFAPEPFSQTEWIRYTGSQTLALILGAFGATLFFAGFHVSMSSIVVEEAGSWVKMEAESGYLPGIAVSAVGGTLFSLGRTAWTRAKRFKRLVERRAEFEGGDSA